MVVLELVVPVSVVVDEVHTPHEDGHRAKMPRLMYTGIEQTAGFMPRQRRPSHIPLQSSPGHPVMDTVDEVVAVVVLEMVAELVDVELQEL